MDFDKICRMITVAFHDLGCKVNSYEADRMRQKLAENGFRLVPFDRPADVYIINTCSVTNIADRKTRQMLHRAGGLNPKALIAAAGCYVNVHGKEELLSDGVELCILNEEKENIAELLKEALSSRSSLFPEEELPLQEPLSSPDPYAHTRAWLKCQDGCNMFCSYCIIPYARGRIRSRKIADILEEASDLAQAGYREFILTGIHLSSYGLDRPSEGEDLMGLLQALSELPDLKRIRLGSLEPGIITPEFVSGLKELPKLCPHFHLSLQSGCDSVLKRMNRHYTAKDYAGSVSLLRSAFDQPAVTTDIIVGFPGETEEEFEQTVSFVKEIRFYETHIFKYSRRKGTVADRMEGQLSDAVKSARSDVLLSLHGENKKAFQTQYLKGRSCELLLEEPLIIDGKEYLTGYTREYIRAACPAEGRKSGDILSGTLTDALTGDILLFSVS